MSEIASASINSFGTTSPKADFVPPPEQLITLTFGQLEDLITQATEPLYREIALDRQRIAALENRGIPQSRGKRTISRAEMLRTLLKAKGGGMTFKEAEKALGIKPNQMTRLIESLDRRSFEVFTRSGDSRQRVIRLIASNPFT
jgi:DNA-binding MarR family transcriptional regulator